MEVVSWVTKEQTEYINTKVSRFFLDRECKQKFTTALCEELFINCSTIVLKFITNQSTTISRN